MWAACQSLPLPAYDATTYYEVQESEVLKVGHRPRLQMLVTDVWLVAAIILRLEERPAPRGTGLS